MWRFDQRHRGPLSWMYGLCGWTDLATDIQTDGELGSMGQTDHSQEVPEVRAAICGTTVNTIFMYNLYVFSCISNTKNSAVAREKSNFSITCSEHLLVQTAHGGHGNWNVFKATHQAKITKIPQFNALLGTLRHTLTLEDFV